MWKMLDGYFWPYRINEDAQIEKLWPSGEWRPVKPYIMREGRGAYAQGILAVHLKLADGTRRNVMVKHLMADAFLGGRKPGDAYTHRNGCISDCSLGNIVKTTQSSMGKLHGGGMRKSVEKIDRDGNVLDLYSSVTEAAKKNYVSRKVVYYRCTDKIEGDPFSLLGYSFRYEDCDRDVRMERKKYYTRVIEKIDRDGNVVDVYPNMEEAARAHGVNLKNIQIRCDGSIKSDPFEPFGYSFRWRKLKGD